MPLSYTDLVDVHGPTRLQSLASFRLIPELAHLSDAALHQAVWPAWQAIVADLLDLTDCPNCDGVGSLGEEPDEIPCPTCAGDGWVYARRIVDVARPVKDPALPAKTSTGRRPDRPPRPAPLEVPEAKATRRR